jgi:hypothetical protein
MSEKKKISGTSENKSQESLSWEQKCLNRINGLKHQLEAAEKRFHEGSRKKRNGELIAFGVLVEELFKAGDSGARQKWKDGAQKHLTPETLRERALEGFKRLEEPPPSPKISAKAQKIKPSKQSVPAQPLVVLAGDGEAPRQQSEVALGELADVGHPQETPKLV